MRAKDEILEEGSASHLAYAAAESAAINPSSFVTAAGHDIGKQLLHQLPTPFQPQSHTAIRQLQAEHDLKVVHNTATPPAKFPPLLE